MWKIVVGFVALAAVALWLLSKSGDVNMGGDEHGGAAPHAPDVHAPASAAASASK